MQYDDLLSAGDDLSPADAVSLREENDRRELAIYGQNLSHMRLLRSLKYSVWLIPETAEWPEEHGVERVFNVGTAPMFESEMVALAMRESEALTIPYFLRRTAS
jgi:hypothetical protein